MPPASGVDPSASSLSGAAGGVRLPIRLHAGIFSRQRHRQVAAALRRMGGTRASRPAAIRGGRNDCGRHRGEYRYARPAVFPLGWDGRVIAIEAQPTVCQVLSANCRRNGRDNVEVINAICAETGGRRECHLNYDDEQNVGGISFSALKHSGWRRLLRWLPGFNDPRIADIPVIALDDLSLTETVSFIKLDIEGMELDALRGAHATIARFRPVIFFEQNDAKRLSDTHDYLVAAGYRMFWLETHPFNRNNYRGDTENIWWRTETGSNRHPAAGHAAGRSGGGQTRRCLTPERTRRQGRNCHRATNIPAS